MKKLWVIVLLVMLVFTGGCVGETVTTEQEGQTSYPATIRGRVLTGSGDMITAGIIITYPDGDMERVNTNILSGYTLLLEEGDYTLTFTRGMEYRPVTREISVENYKTYYMKDVRLNQVYDGAQDGWYIGDLHQHSTFSDGKQGVTEVLKSNINNGLYFGFLSDHNTAGGLAEWVQGNRLVANYDPQGNPINFVAMRGVEVTTDYGHYQSLGVGNVLRQADINPLKGDVPVEEVETIAEEIVRSGAIATINHPFATSLLGFDFWELAGEFDAIEIWNGLYVTNRNENLAAKDKWFELLEDHRAGELKFLPATGGSDNHDITGYYEADYADTSTDRAAYKDAYLRRGLYSGMPANCVYIDDELSRESIMDAIENGHNYLTNGPRIAATIDDAIYGETVSLDGRDAIEIDFDVFSQDPIREIRITKNGQTYHSFEFSDEEVHEWTQTYSVQDVSAGDWFVFEVIGDRTSYAITNPIFIGE